MKTEDKRIDENNNVRTFINEDRSFTVSNYIEMFLYFINEPDKKFDFIYYEHEEDEHISREFINDINNIQQLATDGADVIRGFYSSSEKAYELRYATYDAKKIELIESVKKEKTK